MTTPGEWPDPPIHFPPSCTVWVERHRLADGCTDWETSTDLTVLTDLSVTWGRPNTLDQPDPATATFRVMEEGGGSTFTSVLKIGAWVDVKAEATIFVDPTESIFTYDPGFEGAPALVTPPGGVVQVNSHAIVTGNEAHTGNRSVVVYPAAGVKSPTPVRALFPPAPFGAIDAWDGIPQTAVGQTWRFGASVKTINALGWGGTQVTVRPVYWTRPTAGAYGIIGPAMVSSPNGAWKVLEGNCYPPPGVWMGICIEITPLNRPKWSEVPVGTTWDSLGAGDLLRTNLFNDPQGANLLGGWLNHGWGPSGNGTMASFLIADGPFGGGGSLQSVMRKTWSAASTNASAAATGFYTGRSATPADYFPITPNTVYTMSVYYRHTSAKAKSANFVAYQYDSGKVNVAVPATVLSLPPNVWTRVSVTFTSAATAVYLRPTPTIASGLNNQEWGIGETLEVTGLLLEKAPAPVGVYFDGDTPDTSILAYEWTAGPNKSTSTVTNMTNARPTWRDLGSVFVDDLVMKSPSGGGLRNGTVFGGRITNLVAKYDSDVGATVIDVTAQSPLAELDNRYVGDTPWPKEHLHLRFDRIVNASGQDLSYTVDPTVANVNVTWRDVDSTPAGDLLHELAQSVGGALWSAVSDIRGAYLWLEDIDNRPATQNLVMDPDNVVRIHRAEIVADGNKFIEIDACDVLLDPVEWEQTTEDDGTRITLQWMDQTKDDEGNEAPTQREVIADDPGQERLTGRRNISISTVLSDIAEATSTANSILARATTPGWRVTGLTWSADSADPLDAYALQRMMTILDGVTRNGLGIILTNLPTWAPSPIGQDVPLFLEGGRFTNNEGAWTLELLTSSAISQGKAMVRWQDLPGFLIIVRTNIATNPRAISTGADGWLDTRGFNTGGAGVYSYVTGITTSPGGGISTSRRKQWTATATANTGSAGFEVRASATTNFPVTAGKTYTVAVWMRHTSTTVKTMVMRATFQDSGGATFGTTVVGGQVAIAPTAGATRANRALNPRAESGGAAGWLTTRGFGTGGAGTHTFVAVTGPSGTGTTSARRKTWTTAATNSDLTGNNLAADATNWFAVTPGETITVSCYARHNSSTTKDFSMALAFYDGVVQASAVALGGATYGSNVQVAGSGTWVRFSHTMVVPAGAFGMRAIADVRGGAGTPWNLNAWMDMTALLIETAATVGDYFDGSSGGGTTTTYSWLGTANASASAANEFETAWSRVTLTTIAPAGAVGMRVFPDTASAAEVPWQLGESLSATGLLIEAADAAAGYFDGSSADSVVGTVTVDNEWTGTAHASSSVQTSTDTSQGWSWDEFDPAISWNDLQGTGIQV